MMARRKRSPEGGLDDFITGIRDNITIAEIFTRISWEDLPSVSCVSKSWRRALKEIREARMLAQSTQSLVPVAHAIGGSTNVSKVLSLLDAALDRWYLAPNLLPWYKGGFPDGCGIISLDGKIYIIGGCLEMQTGETKRATRKVYSLDLAAGERKWKRCADMNYARGRFQCGVIDGNIYVFWGAKAWNETQRLEANALDNTVEHVEVYDPNVDQWDCVEPAPCLDIVKSSANIKVLIRGDRIFEIHFFLRALYSYGRPESYLTVYNYDTLTDIWTLVDCRLKDEEAVTGPSFTMDNQLYKLNARLSTLLVYSEDLKEWKSSEIKVSWQPISPNSIPVLYTEIISVTTFLNHLHEKELIALARTTGALGLKRLVLLKGKLSGTIQRELVFSEIRSHPFNLVEQNLPSHALCV